MRVLVAIDGSVCSYSAVAEVARRPWPAGSEFRVVMVEPAQGPSLVGNAPPRALEEIVKAEQGEALKHLQNAVAVLAQSGIASQVSSALLQGMPKDTIIAAAEEWGADLIIVGSHGYGPVRRFFLGSVSNYVVNNAPCSVEIIRARNADPSVIASSS